MHRHSKGSGTLQSESSLGKSIQSFSIGIGLTLEIELRSLLEKMNMKEESCFWVIHQVIVL